MNIKIIKTLYKKELTDIFRDKKTILMMIIVPIILYPLLFVGSMLLMNRVASSSTIDSFKVAFSDSCYEEGIVDYFTENAPKKEYNFIIVESADPEKDVREGNIRAYVDTSIKDDKKNFNISFMSSDTYSSTAYQMIADIISMYEKEMQTKMLEELGIDAEYYLNPVSISTNNLASNEETAGSVLGSIIPFLLISSVLMGAMYPAIDVTAGEKERGTLETVLTLPVKSVELIVSKFLATSTVAILSAFLNVLSIGIVGGYFYATFSTSLGNVEFSFSSYIPAIIGMLFVISIFALFASAVNLLVCIFARSFKEAQNLTSPIMIVFLMAGMAGMLPGIAFNMTSAMIPVVNVSLLISQLFQFKFDPYLFLIVILVNVAYTVIITLIMSRLFSIESVLFSDGSRNLRLLERRGNMAAGQMPGVGDMSLVLAVILIILIYSGTILVLKFGLYGVVIQQLLFVLFIALYSWYIKADYKKLFSIKTPRPLSVIGSVITWLGGFIIMLIMAYVIEVFWKGTAKLQENDVLMLIEGKPLWIIIAVVALTPAICEEIVFRGFVFGTLSNKFKPVTAIIWTGILFGAYHLSVEKLITVGFLGVIMAYVVYKTGSIFLSMIMHFCNNAIAMVVSVYPDAIFKILPFTSNIKMTPINMSLFVCFGIIVLVLGIFILKFDNRVKYIGDKN